MKLNLMQHELLLAIELAFKNCNIQLSTYENIKTQIDADILDDWAYQSLLYLVKNQKWDSLNNRFVENLKFGTGGFRGRTIDHCITPSEQGKYLPPHAPEHPALGTCYLNHITVIRATIGLYHYAKEYLIKTKRDHSTPTLVIAYDVRHFSKYFSSLVAVTWEKLGGIAHVFEGPRSTPQLSFTVRQLKATAGVVITASHNPPHDNGYKVYFEDGGQIVSPHAEAITEHIYKIPLSSLKPYIQNHKNHLTCLSQQQDNDYITALQKIILNQEDFIQYQGKIIYSNLHGTGLTSIPKVFESFHYPITIVQEQSNFDGNFSTVQSPNPENPESFTLSIEVAKKINADLILVTDPDCDRMGAAILNTDKTYTCLTGNQISCLLLNYRIKSLKQAHLLPKNGSKNAVCIKTYVTSPMQESIARKEGISIINTLTGFKWIGSKLNQYEQTLKTNLKKAGIAYETYLNASEKEKIEWELKYSQFFVFGSEESYGSLSVNFIRDKDAAAGCLLFADLLSQLKKENKTILDQLHELYLEHGYFYEDLLNIHYQGTSGMQIIQKILNYYSETPPKEINHQKVIQYQNFQKDTILDNDNQMVPKESFYILELENNISFAVRASGTEPKIKFYLFGHKIIKDLKELSKTQELLKNQLTQLKQNILNTIKHFE